MTLTQLRTFVVLAETGSVRAAAERLTVTQSAVSAAVTSLAREIGASLVEREGRGVRLTLAGETYARYARRVLGLLDEGRLAAVDAAGPEGGRLRLAAVTSAGEHVVAPLLASFRAKHPGVGVTLEVGTRERVWGLVRDHRVDVAIGGRPPPAAGLVTRAVRRNELVVVAAPGRAADAAVPWLLREPGSGTRETAEALLEQLGIDPVRLTLGSNGATVAGAVAGLGLALVSRDAVRDELADGRLEVVEVAGTPLDRPYHLATHEQVSSTVRRFLEDVLAVSDAGGFRLPVTRRGRRRGGAGS